MKKIDTAIRYIFGNLFRIILLGQQIVSHSGYRKKMSKSWHKTPVGLKWGRNEKPAMPDTINTTGLNLLYGYPWSRN
jgi:hypothetical protein